MYVRPVNLESFVRLWRGNGTNESWAWYARELGVNTETLRRWIARHREELRERYGLDIPIRQARVNLELFPWPTRRPEHRDQTWCRFLEREQRAREFGPQSLTDKQRERWVAARAILIDGGLVVAYDVERGYYTREATEEERSQHRFSELLPDHQTT